MSINWRSFLLILLFLLLIIVTTMFIVMYNRLDEYKKDKEILLSNKEDELKNREKIIVQNENFIIKLKECEKINNNIKNILNSYINSNVDNIGVEQEI